MVRLDTRSSRGRSRPHRGRHFCFTFHGSGVEEGTDDHHITAEDCAKWQTVLTLGNDAPGAEKLTFFIFQTEKGEERGRVHYQGYASFKSKVSWNTLKEMLGNSLHIKAAAGNAAQNIKYCTKEDTRWTGDDICINGHWGVPTGSGNNLLAATAIQAGASFEKIDSSYPVLTLMHPQRVNDAICRAKGPRTEVPKIIILVGATGTGKTRWCVENHRDAYWLPPPAGTRLWWTGYNGQDVVVLDEFTSSWMRLTFWLGLNDAKPFSVEPKGSVVPFNSGTLIYTSNVDPVNWYKNYKGDKLHKDAMERRIQEFAEIFDCTAERVVTPRGVVFVSKQVKRTGVFKFAEQDFSYGTSAPLADYPNPAGVGDMNYGNGFY